MLRRLSKQISININSMMMIFKSSTNEKIDGVTLLKLEIKQLRHVGLGLGPARRIVVSALKIEKGLVEPDLLSKSDFLALSPPALTYINRPISTVTTKATHAHTPQSVVAWDGFENDVNSTIRRDADDIPKYPQPTFQRYTSICNEEDVRDALYHNLLRPLNTVLERHEVFGRHPSLKHVIAEPDFIQRSSDQDLHLVIEVTTKRSLSVHDLQLRQIYAYLSYNRLRFGALTTYDKTWFLHRTPESRGQLRISPAIRYDNQQPTLFQCLFYLTLLARKGHYCAEAPSSPPSGDGDSLNEVGRLKQNAGNRKRSREHNTLLSGGGPGPNSPSDREEEHTSLGFFDWGSFDVLGYGRTGTVFKAILHGKVVALKLCDLWQHPDYEKELLNEVKVYHSLKDLQGGCIPRLKGAGYTAGGLFAIAIDIVGEPLKDAESLSDEERLAIQRALLRIHRHGFVHNDIRKDNILIKRDGCQFCASIIDFAFSEPGCQRGFKKEMVLLTSLLK